MWTLVGESGQRRWISKKERLMRRRAPAARSAERVCRYVPATHRAQPGRPARTAGFPGLVLYFSLEKDDLCVLEELDLSDHQDATAFYSNSLQQGRSTSGHPERPRRVLSYHRASAFA